MNQNIAELEEALKHCADEPIHILGQIQPYGTLISLDLELTILQISANTQDFFKINEPEILGQPLSYLVGADNAKHIGALIARQNGLINTSEIPGTLNLSLWVNSSPRPTNLIVQLHFSEGVIVAEFAYSSEFITKDLYAEMTHPISLGLREVNNLENLNDYVHNVVDKIRRITGYDRVMMYRFDSHWDGEVIAESYVEGLESFLGLRFPASDIPPQARKLYTKNRFRLLADTEVTPCPIIPPINPQTEKPLDLSFAVLRSFSPVHIKYLRNMKVRASMSISLLQNGRLWGLIACHHRRAKYLDYQIRSVAEVICNTVSNKLSELEIEQRLLFQKQTRETVFELTRYALASSDPLAEILSHFEQNLLALMNASGAIISIGGRRFSIGNIASEATVAALLHHLQTKPSAEVFYTDCLANEIQAFKEYQNIASGMLVAPIGKDMSEFVMWFRPEEISTVRWAGAPQSPELDDENKFRISPRKSFADWLENRRGYANAWNSIEISESYNLALSIIIAFSGKAPLSS